MCRNVMLIIDICIYQLIEDGLNTLSSCISRRDAKTWPPVHTAPVAMTCQDISAQRVPTLFLKGKTMNNTYCLSPFV